jgi:hypothetical protein
MWKFYKRPQLFGNWICVRPQAMRETPTLLVRLETNLTMVYVEQNYLAFFWTLSIVSYVEVLQKTTTFRRLDLCPSSGGWGRVDRLSWARQKELVSITGQTPVRRKQLINTRQPVSSVGDRNKITIKDTIEICAKHAHVKNVKKRKYELGTRNSVKTKVKNLEDAWLISANKELCRQGDVRESD